MSYAYSARGARGTRPAGDQSLFNKSAAVFTGLLAGLILGWVILVSHDLIDDQRDMFSDNMCDGSVKLHEFILHELACGWWLSIDSVRGRDLVD